MNEESFSFLWFGNRTNIAASEFDHRSVGETNSDCDFVSEVEFVHFLIHGFFNDF
jgi:hypothetical protein